MFLRNVFLYLLWIVFMGVASLPEGKSRGLCLAHLCAKYRLVSAYVESLPLVLKGKRSCFSQGERYAVQLPLDHALALRK